MGVLLFSKEIKEAAKKLQTVIESLVPKGEIEIYQTIESLSSRFHRPRGNLAILILLAASKKDLIDLLLIRQLFNDIPIILILPDRDKETILQGRKLFPRFISFADGDCLDVDAVLGKMVKHMNINK